MTRELVSSLDSSVMGSSLDSSVMYLFYFQVAESSKQSQNSNDKDKLFSVSYTKA